MGNTEGSTQPDPPQTESPDSTDAPSGPALLGLLATALLFLVVGFVVLMLASLFVVFATGAAARRFGLPELPVTLVFFGLVALLVVGFVGARLGSEIRATSARLEYALDEASDKVANDLSASMDELTSTIEEGPAVIVDPVVAPLHGPGGKPRQRRR